MFCITAPVSRSEPAFRSVSATYTVSDCATGVAALPTVASDMTAPLRRFGRADNLDRPQSCQSFGRRRKPPAAGEALSLTRGKLLRRGTTTFRSRSEHVTLRLRQLRPAHGAWKGDGVEARLDDTSVAAEAPHREARSP